MARLRLGHRFLRLRHLYISQVGNKKARILRGLRAFSSANVALPTGDDLYTLCIGGLYIPVFIPSVNPRDATMGALLELTIDIATRYHDCAARHRRLAQWAADPDGVTPGP